MAFSSNDDAGSGFTEPNVVPLVDVMLVMLIIFMVTTPLMSHKVKVELPEATIESGEKYEGVPITLAVKSNGELYWNDERVTKSILESRLAIEAQRQPQPQINVRGDKDTKYRIIADVMQTAKLQGIAKLGFITHPEK
ncbi:MAG: biopolymer transporter ExbD [Lysobacteraceae bacterium]